MGRKAGERMEMKNIFPGIRGNDALRTRLARDILSGAGLAHAYIIEGKHGSGRHTLAVNIAAALSCVIKFVPLFSSITSGFSVIICTVLAAAAGALIFPKPVEDGEADD